MRELSQLFVLSPSILYAQCAIIGSSGEHLFFYLAFLVHHRQNMVYMKLNSEIHHTLEENVCNFEQQVRFSNDKHNGKTPFLRNSSSHSMKSMSAGACGIVYTSGRWPPPDNIDVLMKLTFYFVNKPVFSSIRSSTAPELVFWNILLVLLIISFISLTMQLAKLSMSVSCKHDRSS